MTAVVVAGGGAMGTALANVIALTNGKPVKLYLRDRSLRDTINQRHENPKYFPATPLCHDVSASTEIECFSRAEVVFLAVPSGAILKMAESIKPYLDKDVILVNLAKGLGVGMNTLVQGVEEITGRETCSMKGPTFACEIIRNSPTAFTLATTRDEVRDCITALFQNSQVRLDYSSNINGVEFSSILKNIYAIVIGVVDAQLNSANARFLVMTKASWEMREALDLLTGGGDVIHKYCGYGDLGLTALNDMSRNRTLGLLIGKGFLSSVGEQGVILEGAKALNAIWDSLGQSSHRQRFPIMGALAGLVAGEIDVQQFVADVLE